MNLFLKAWLKKELMNTEDFEKEISSTKDVAAHYREVENSEKLKEFKLLDATVTTDFFVQKKAAFMKNQSKAELKRWYATDDGKDEKRYLELKKDADICWYLQMDAKNIERIEALEEVMMDDMNWHSLSDSQWKPGFRYPNDSFQALHSFTNECQAYTGGNNIRTANSILTLDTRKESVTATAWDEKKGLIKFPFDYTSDCIHSDIPLDRNGGVIHIKARCRGKVNHGAYLRSAKHLPMMAVFDYVEGKVFCGLKKSQEQNDWHLLKGLKPLPYIIYTVAWNKNEITWFVNNLKVHTLPNTLPADEPMYLHLFSFILGKQRRKGEGRMEIDWVRQFRLKENI